MCYFKAKFHENIETLQNSANPLDQGCIIFRNEFIVLQPIHSEMNSLYCNNLK